MFGFKQKKDGAHHILHMDPRHVLLPISNRPS
ncbi:Uncharacterised protein [Vibrio cholerae]|nr:Uncharacterised protein [Vibrio cholerae]